jgi:hypothetical protein
MFSRRAARRCRCPKIKTVSRSTIKFVHWLAVSEAHGPVWVSKIRSVEMLAPKQYLAATYSSPLLAEVDRRPATASNCVREFELAAKISLVGDNGG